VALFVVTCIDKPDSLALRMATREAHFAYAGSKPPGMIKLGGPFLDAAGDMTGSLVILEAEDLAEAKRFNAEDPYTLAGLFQSVDVRPWRVTFGSLP
jgi:uncharacterized protein YciI